MKINIIGGGVAGLVTGIYLQKNGFETEIFEQHSTLGGLCTGWKRGEYTFNGCMHWLLGSTDNISFYTFWKEVLDLNQIKFVYHKERVQFDVPNEKDKYGRSTFHFLNNIDEFEKYLLDIAPEDSKIIKYWMNQVRFVGKYLNDLPPVFYDEGLIKSFYRKIKLARLLPMLFFMLKWRNKSNYDFAKKFKNSFLKKAVTMLYEKEMRMQILLFVQSYANKKVAGYPIGCSLHFSKLLEESYLKNGGKVRTNCTVKYIETDKNKAKSLVLDNEEKKDCDIVISAADWHWTIFEALKGKFVTKKQFKFKEPSKEQIFYSFCILYLGINIPLKNYPHFIRFSLDEPIISPDGTTYDILEVQIYNYDNTLAPEGKVTLAVDFQTREFDYWINLRNRDIEQYKKIKNEFKDKITEVLCSKIKDLEKNNIEVYDLTTPATYYRYTKNYRGSSQGWTPQNNLLNRLPITNTVTGLDNVYLVGHWQEAGGGIPIALKSARDVAWTISKKYNNKFIV